MRSVRKMKEHMRVMAEIEEMETFHLVKAEKTEPEPTVAEKA